MRRVGVLVLLALIGPLAACATPVSGQPVALPEGQISAPFAPASSPPTTTTEPTRRTTATATAAPSGTAVVPAGAPDVCKLLTWADLPYKDQESAPSPSEQGFDKDFDESCRWRVSVDSLDIGISLRFRVGKSITLTQTSGTYDVAGRKVPYFDNSNTSDKPNIQPSCVMVMDYAGGGLGIIVIDGSFRYGPICDQGKHVAEVLAGREPH